MLPVVLIGGIHHNMLGVVRALGERGVPKDFLYVIIIGQIFQKRNIISASKYLSLNRIRYIQTDAEIFDVLLTIAKDGKKKIIICCSDGSATEVMKHKCGLQDTYYLPSLNMDVVDLMSKENQTKIAFNCGLTVPKSDILKCSENPQWNIFPCITKPIKSTLGAGKADIYVSYSMSELKKVLKETQSECVQIQEFIEKSMEFQLIGCSLDCGNRVIIPGYTDIIRQPENTNTGYLKYNPINQLNFDLSGVKKFIQTIGYSGLFSVEFLRGKDGCDYFMEINMRNDGNAYCVTSAGVNLPYIWYYYNAYGKMPKEEPLSFEKSVYFIPDIVDLKRGITAVGVFGWIKQFVKAESHSTYNKYDKMPFLVDVWNFCKRQIHKVVKRH